MAKLISTYEPAVLLSVEKLVDVSDREWNWRMGYIGKPGRLRILESEHKHPGQKFVHLVCYTTNDLKTGCGELNVVGSLITITTKNSRYVFKTEALK